MQRNSVEPGHLQFGSSDSHGRSHLRLIFFFNTINLVIIHVKAPLVPHRDTCSSGAGALSDFFFKKRESLIEWTLSYISWNQSKVGV